MKKNHISKLILFLVLSFSLLVSCPNKPNTPEDPSAGDIEVSLSGFDGITGFVNKEIDPIILNFTIKNSLFSPISASDKTKNDVSSFFSKKVDGLNYVVSKNITGIGSDTLEVKISGTPTREISEEFFTIKIDKSYIKEASRSVEIKGNYKQSILNKSDVILPSLSSSDVKIVSLIGKDIKETKVSLTIQNTTFDEANINKEENGLLSWIVPPQNNGLKYTFDSLNASKDELTLKITGSVNSIQNDKGFTIIVPKKATSLNLTDVSSKKESIVLNVSPSPSVLFQGSENQEIEGRVDENSSVDYTLKIKFQNAKILNSEDDFKDVKSWFEKDAISLPDWLNAVAVIDDADNSVLNITLSGKPTTVNNNEVYLTIPEAYYSYENAEIDETLYPKVPLNVDLKGLKFNITDPNGIYIKDKQKKRIVAFTNTLLEENENATNSFILVSERVKFNSDLKDRVVTSWFTQNTGDIGFEYSVSSISEDGLSLNIDVKDKRNSTQLKSTNTSAINIVFPESAFENGEIVDTKNIHTDLSYYIKEAPSVRLLEPSTFKAILNKESEKSTYNLRVQGVNFSSIFRGSDVSSFFYNQSGSQFNLDGLNYVVENVQNNDSYADIVLSIKGTPTTVISGDDEDIFIRIPKDIYNYTDSVFATFAKKDLLLLNSDGKEQRCGNYQIFDINAYFDNAVVAQGKMVLEAVSDGSGSNGVDVSLTLEGASFSSIPANTSVRSWFGEKAKIFKENEVYVKNRVYSGSKNIVIHIEGTPQRVGDIRRLKEKMVVTIPSDYLQDIEMPSIIVDSTSEGDSCMWEISGSTVVVVDGLNAPLAAVVNHPDSLNNTTFDLHLEDNYFDTKYLSETSYSSYDEWFVNLPSYLTASVSFYDEVQIFDRYAPQSAHITIKAKNATIDYACTDEFSVNIAPEALLLYKDQGAEFDDTSIPDIARNYSITEEPIISVFDVRGAIYGIVNKDIEAFTNSYSSSTCYNTFGVQITLDGAYFQDGALTSDNIASWFSNYVPISGLQFDYMVLNSPSVIIDGEKKPQAIWVSLSGTPKEAKLAFTSTDGTRELEISSQKGEILQYVNRYANPCSITLKSSTVAYHIGVSQTTENRCTDDGVYKIGVKISAPSADLSSIGFGNVVPNVISIENIKGSSSTPENPDSGSSTDTVATIKFNPSAIDNSFDLVKEGWVLNDVYSSIENQSFSLKNSLTDVITDGYVREYFTFKDERSSSNTKYSYNNVSILIPGKYLKPSFLDYGGKLFKDEIPKFKIATNNST